MLACITIVLALVCGYVGAPVWWAAVAAVFRYSSLAALMAAGSSPVIAGLMGQGRISFLCLALAILIYIRHAANIARLRAGTESRIGRRA